MNLKLIALVAVAATVGWLNWSSGVDCQSVKVTCKYARGKNDHFLYCSEKARISGREYPKCIVNSACSQHRPIYQFTTWLTNSTKECQSISRCMLSGGAKICHRGRACDADEDINNCEQAPEPFEAEDCLKSKSRAFRHRGNAHRVKFDDYQ